MQGVRSRALPPYMHKPCDSLRRQIYRRRELDAPVVAAALAATTGIGLATVLLPVLSPKVMVNGVLDAVITVPSGGQGMSLATRGWPIGTPAWPLRTAAMSSGLGYWLSSQ
jgi:hypothetical protein